MVKRVYNGNRQPFCDMNHVRQVEEAGCQ